ncbi:hypothetical protein L209DRAFT_463471 [Thermothelomyces heterothallicus CBS 203.75]
MLQSIPAGPNKDVGLGGRGRGNIPFGLYRSGKHLIRRSVLGSVQVLEVLVGGVLPRRRGHACSCRIVLPDGEVVRQDIEYSERRSFTDMLTGKASTESEQVNVQLGITVGQPGYRGVAWQHAWPQIGVHCNNSVLPCRARWVVTSEKQTMQEGRCVVFTNPRKEPVAESKLRGPDSHTGYGVEGTKGRGERRGGGRHPSCLPAKPCVYCV